MFLFKEKGMSARTGGDGEEKNNKKIEKRNFCLKAS